MIGGKPGSRHVTFEIRLARRHADHAHQSLARSPHRRVDALGLRQDRRLKRQRVLGTSLTKSPASKR